MAVVNTKSNYVTNADATPMVRSQRSLCGAPVLTAVATLEVASGDDDGSIYRFVRLPSNAVIHSIGIYNDALTSGTDYDLGLYQTAANGGAVVDKDILVDGTSMASARVAALDGLFVTNDIANIEKKLYELIPLTTDPQRDYDLCLTANTVGSASGTISIKVLYTV